MEVGKGVSLTDGAAADNRDLSLLRRGGHTEGARSTIQVEGKGAD